MRAKPVSLTTAGNRANRWLVRSTLILLALCPARCQAFAGFVQKSTDLRDVDEPQGAEKQARPPGFDAHSLEALENATNDGQVSLELAVEIAKLSVKKGDLTAAFSSYESAIAPRPECIGCVSAAA